MDQKEALQAFVSKAAAVLMADEDLRLITEESLGTECKTTVDEYSDTLSPDLSNQGSFNSIDNDGLPNVQIIVPPEEFANSIDNMGELIKNQELSTPEDCLKEAEIMELLLNESDFIDDEIKFIDSVINGVERDTDSDQRLDFETRDKEPESQTNDIDQQKLMIDKSDTSGQIGVVTTDTPIESPMEETKSDPIVEETKHNSSLEEETTLNDIEVTEEKKTIEHKVEPIVNTSEKIESFNNSLNSNDNNINNDFNLFNEKDLFGDIDELNREIEALEELVEYEIKMETLKASKNKSSQEISDKLEHQTSIESTKDSKHKESNKTADKSSKRNAEKDQSLQTQNGNKYSPPMSLIPRRLPSAAPRKSKSFCNLSTLQFSPCKSPDKKPSLIPRPVSASKTNLTTISISPPKSESPKQNQRSDTHFLKVQNGKTAHRSKTRILSERKKYEVMNSPNEFKRTVHHRNSKSDLKCKSMMDLTATAFSSGKDL